MKRLRLKKKSMDTDYFDSFQGEMGIIANLRLTGNRGFLFPPLFRVFRDFGRFLSGIEKDTDSILLSLFASSDPLIRLTDTLTVILGSLSFWKIK